MLKPQLSALDFKMNWAFYFISEESTFFFFNPSVQHLHEFDFLVSDDNGSAKAQ